MFPRSRFLFLLWLVGVVGCPCAHSQPVQRVESSVFGKMPDGKGVECYTLRNTNGMRVKIMTYGATITEMLVPDAHGAITNVVLGADQFDAYLKGFPAAASVIGRYANRIAKARFTLNGVEYKLAANNGPNHIHGGIHGFAQALWQGQVMPPADHTAAVRLLYVSKDGEEGYPGNLKVKVTYTLTDDNKFQIAYEAATDKATPLNLTSHTYFNLAGAGSVLGHRLWLAAEKYTPVDEQLIPTGKIAPVSGTPLDFTKPMLIGERIEQLKPGFSGYDHNFVLSHDRKELVLAARVTDPASGRTMEVRTTEPGVQLYTGNHLGGSNFPKHPAFCLETQHYPDSVHQPAFPSTILEPGQTFRSTTSFAFMAQ